jgi:hypothetical protein
MRLAEFEGYLERIKESDHFSLQAESAVGALRASDEDPLQCIKVIIRFMEGNPDVDFGSPGTLVHYLEEFLGRGYENELVESVGRRPNAHTVWMLNRVINGSAGPRMREVCLRALADVAGNCLVEPGVRELAEEFYRYQTD